MIATDFLVLIIIIVSVAGIIKPTLQDKLAFIPYNAKHKGEWYRFFTCTLVHANLFHLLVNMYVLRFFGKFVERDYALYFGAKWEAVLLPVLFFTGSAASVWVTYKKYKDDKTYSAVGASGAVSTIVFTVFMYRTFSSSNIGAFSISLAAFAFVYLLYSAIVNYRNTKGDVNHDAHLYGALYGILINIIAKPSLLLGFWYSLTELFQNMIPILKTHGWVYGEVCAS